ncbi:3,4-dihydroxy-2-butanone-4-phosphate synthase [Candidatus Anaplasma sp. TIGMIC]|uniref:3,4-dihydroxy-2-butanone-4-phosphate synthase n=1 Tax=Candidatus Anaplasma sp. TIGMIC TaxID=3020713 RepID=UPI00232C47C0|nr:3,4-dihydroxy-2-butanone-4-phosphate synthase [Candidatus Anaplasma sp. TIGMIC]MDB1135633.1 3,4-dihydroxy-2-butanone-4-phosphate synthase [Candidatus Anaplasma sp. TIGMIC]
MSLRPSAAACVFSSIEEVVKDAAAGKVFVLLDDEERENEGDMVVLADKVSPEAISLMVRHGSGIVCLALSGEHAERLDLSLMPRRNANDGCPSFTVSIDAKDGITTGVSAQDRAATILLAASKSSKASDFVTPGHIFPIVAHPGGVRKRAGHTEAGVEIAALAGSEHAAVICELMNPDGSMSRGQEIFEFAQMHDLRVTTIKKLIEYLGGS